MACGDDCRFLLRHMNSTSWYVYHQEVLFLYVCRLNTGLHSYYDSLSADWYFLVINSIMISLKACTISITTSSLKDLLLCCTLLFIIISVFFFSSGTVMTSFIFISSFYRDRKNVLRTIFGIFVVISHCIINFFYIAYFFLVTPILLRIKRLKNIVVTEHW